MSFCLVQSRALIGLQALPVRVEIHLSNGLPSFQIVGLPDAEVKESRERVRCALLNSGFEFPTRRITVNLAPADLPKGSGRFDLPIAIGIAAANGQLPNIRLEEWEFSGELSLSGEILPSAGAFALALSLQKDNLHTTEQRMLMIGANDAQQAGCVDSLRVYGANTLLEACAHLVGHGTPLERIRAHLTQYENTHPDLKDVKGQALAKRALEIAAAGGHHLLMVGTPGSGKSMLANRLPSLLPNLSETEALETAALRSLRGLPLDYGRRPFESPHHSASAAALVGGGKPPQPGSISMAHHGVLFLDEALEFDRRCLEALREPLETGMVHIARAGVQMSYPAKFQWIVAHNPCPCGWLGHPKYTCRCSDTVILRYRNKLSGPLLDRIDIGLEVAPVQHTDLLSNVATESSDIVKKRVIKAQLTQKNRQNMLNGQLNPELIDAHCILDNNTQQWFAKVAQDMGWSARSTHRALKVARTIADLSEDDDISRNALAEALQWRQVLNCSIQTKSSNNAPWVSNENAETTCA